MDAFLKYGKVTFVSLVLIMLAVSTGGILFSIVKGSFDLSQTIIMVSQLLTMWLGALGVTLLLLAILDIRTRLNKWS